MNGKRRTSERISDEESVVSRPLDGLSWLYQEETFPPPGDADNVQEPSVVSYTDHSSFANSYHLQRGSYPSVRNGSATEIDVRNHLERSYAGEASFEPPSDSTPESLDSFASSNSTPRRRKRKRGPMRQREPPHVSHRRRYQCTFCTDTFKNKHDWQRHEGSEHLSLEQWKCARLGPFKEIDGRLCCVFCGQPDPTADHLEGHKYTACLRQPEEARTFCRRDHLRQHIRLFHGGSALRADTGDCRSSIEPVRSRCGFCNTQIESWTERQKHVAEHFRNGSDMMDWKGDRGFDANVERFVQNMKPDVLLRLPRKALGPFSATQTRLLMDTSGFGISQESNKRAHQGGLEDNTSETVHGPTMHSYRHVEGLLLQYVPEQIIQGRVPTDQELQSKTSRLMYGSGSTWNQTWADDAQWLEAFKKKAGLISMPLSGGRNAYIGTDVSQV